MSYKLGVDVILGALIKVVPERVVAACSGAMNLINLGGINPKNRGNLSPADQEIRSGYRFRRGGGIPGRSGNDPGDRAL